MYKTAFRRTALATGATGALLVSLAAAAQDVPATVEPGAIEQEFRAVPDRYSDTPIAVPSASGPTAPAGAEAESFTLQRLDVEGVTVFAGDEIRSLYAGKVGSDITVAELFGIAQSITKMYADAGYPLSVAFVPAQEINDGTARIQVYEGYVAEVEVTGDAGRAQPQLERLAEQLTHERPLSTAVLERYVLLANDLPGISVQAVIDRSAAEPGAVKVIFAVERKRGDFALSLNNRGSRALGPERVQASAAANGVALPGDQLRGDIVLTADTDELTFLSASYDAPVGARGLRLGFATTYSESDPGTELLRALAFNSEGWTAEVDASYPLLRSRGRNIVLSGSFEHKDLESHFDDILNARDILWVGRVRLDMDMADMMGGFSRLGFQVSKGFNFGDATSRWDANKSRERGDGDFVSLLVDAGHVQPLTDNLELSLNGRVQVAGRKLLASEECGYGGAGIGRGFDNFEISGDHCAMASAELRMAPHLLSGQLYGAPYGFFDAGKVWTHGAAPAGQADQEDAQSIGGGVRLSLGDSLSAYLEYAQPLSHDVALEGDRDGRVFFGLTATR